MTSKNRVASSSERKGISPTWILEKPRFGAEEYNRIIQQAQQNGLQTYRIFYHYQGEEKLRLFYYKFVKSYKDIHLTIYA